jgi:hypothetical protein
MPYLSRAERDSAEWRKLPDAVAHVCSVDRCDQNAARQQMRKALADGALGLLRWEDRRPPPRNVGGASIEFDDPPSRGPHWLDTEIDWDRGTVLEFGLIRPEMARRRVLLIHRLALAHLWPAQISRGSARPRVSDRQVRRWYEMRVKECVSAGQQTSEADDWAAARAHFRNSVRQRQIRDLRREFAPTEWRRQGRRSSQKNSEQ